MRQRKCVRVKMCSKCDHCCGDEYGNICFACWREAHPWQFLWQVILSEVRSLWGSI